MRHTSMMEHDPDRSSEAEVSRRGLAGLLRRLLRLVRPRDAVPAELPSPPPSGTWDRGAGRGKGGGAKAGDREPRRPVPGRGSGAAEAAKPHDALATTSAVAGRRRRSRTTARWASTTARRAKQRRGGLVV